MPAVVCHWLLGKRVMETAKKLAGEENFCEKSFFLGCQGPDILFYHRLAALSRKRSLMKYGSKVHCDHPSALFASIKKTLNESGELCKNVLSYALGLCCHYAYDTCAHPFICQLEQFMKQNDERGSDYHYHAHIESALDVIMLRHETGDLITDLRLRRCVNYKEADRAAVALIYANALRDIYGVTTDEKNMRRLAPDMKRLFSLLDDPTMIWRPTVRKLEILLGKDDAPMSAYMRPFMEDDGYDYANIEKEEWHNFMAPQEESCEDFFEMTDRAERKSEDFMKFFMTAEGAEDFSSYTEERSFSNNVDEGAAKYEEKAI